MIVHLWKKHHLKSVEPTYLHNTTSIFLVAYLYAFSIKHFPWHFTLLIFFFSATGWFYGFDKPTLRSMTVFEVGNNTGSTWSGKMMGKPLGWYPYSLYILIYSGYLLGPYPLSKDSNSVWGPPPRLGPQFAPKWLQETDGRFDPLEKKEPKPHNWGLKKIQEISNTFLRGPLGRFHPIFDGNTTRRIHV